MEKATYHEHLTRLREVFPGVESITVPEAAKFYGCKAQTLLGDKTFPAKKWGKSGRYHRVMLINFARWLAG
ncbi:hypothetical protein [Evtepia sp.]|uniref:hypothetical protein n=1 Tax=Evtepia sp. TaxID=2773933 RepID=UPI003F15299E